MQAGTTENFSIPFIDNSTQLPVTGASCNFTFYNQSFLLNLTVGGTSIKEQAGGVYTYAWTAPNSVGLYFANANCTSSGRQLWAWAPFMVTSTLVADETRNITGVNSSVATAANVIGINSSLATQANASSVNNTALSVNASLANALAALLAGQGQNTSAILSGMSGINSSLMNTTHYGLLLSSFVSNTSAILAGQEGINSSLLNVTDLGFILSSFVSNTSAILAGQSGINSSLLNTSHFGFILAAFVQNTSAILAGQSGINSSLMNVTHFGYLLQAHVDNSSNILAVLEAGNSSVMNLTHFAAIMAGMGVNTSAIMTQQVGINNTLAALITSINGTGGGSSNELVIQAFPETAFYNNSQLLVTFSFRNLTAPHSTLDSLFLQLKSFNGSVYNETHLTNVALVNGTYQWNVSILSNDSGVWSVRVNATKSGITSVAAYNVRLYAGVFGMSISTTQNNVDHVEGTISLLNEGADDTEDGTLELWVSLDATCGAKLEDTYSREMLRSPPIGSYRILTRTKYFPRIQQVFYYCGVWTYSGRTASAVSAFTAIPTSGRLPYGPVVEEGQPAGVTGFLPLLFFNIGNAIGNLDKWMIGYGGGFCSEEVNRICKDERVFFLPNAFWVAFIFLLLAIYFYDKNKAVAGVFVALFVLTFIIYFTPITGIGIGVESPKV